MSSIDFAQALNAEQLAAVQAPDGPVLVIAAAGTGKTRTLTYRVAWLVERGVPPNRILLLTFTNRAAREMMERAEQLVGAAVGGLWGGTFHHMANRMLRRHAEALGYRNDYTILDADDTRKLVRACADELKLLGKHFPKPEVLLSLFSLAANREEPVEKIARARFDEHPVDLADVLRVHAAYLARKRALNAMDFDDLLVNGLELFRQHPALLEGYQERFLHILVDEYQDTNKIQAEWVDLMAARHRNLLVVGDDFQSIYSWRGADFRNILSFPQRYAGTTIFKLEVNYRSVPGILNVANACIAGNREQFQKTIRAVRANTVRPTYVRVRDGDAQAGYVVEQIQRLRARGYGWQDLVVLYRSHFHSMELQLLLTRARIPHVVTSGMRFFEQAHVKDACALLRLAVTPGDELAFLRLLALLPKTGEKTALKLWAKLGDRFDPKDAAARDRLHQLLPAAARAPWEQIAAALADVAAAGKLGEAGAVIRAFLTAFYSDFAVENFDNAERRVEDLEELINFTARFDSTEAFLNEMALLTNLDAEAAAPEGEEEQAVKLTTIHQAKGLEWPVVFILWLTDGMFPSGRSVNEEGGEAEERRLFYVATTRAKDELYLLAPEVRRTYEGGLMPCMPSRFLTELPRELLKQNYAQYF